MSGQDATTRQDEILDRTIELLRESGMAGLTMKKVAERVGFTEPAIYRHFPNKHALLLGVADRLGGLFLGPIREIAARTDLPPLERIERMVAHHIGLVCDTDGIPILLLAEATAAGPASDENALGLRMSGFAGAYLHALGQAASELDLPADAPPVDRLVLPVLGLAAAIALERRLLPVPRLNRETALQLARFVVRRLFSTASFEEEHP